VAGIRYLSWTVTRPASLTRVLLTSGHQQLGHLGCFSPRQDFDILVKTVGVEGIGQHVINVTSRVRTIQLKHSCQHLKKKSRNDLHSARPVARSQGRVTSFGDLFAK